MVKQATLSHKRPFLVVLMGLLVLIFFIAFRIRQTVMRSSTLIYPINTQYLSRSEIQDRVNEYFVPPLTRYLGEKGRECTWEYDANDVLPWAFDDVQYNGKEKTSYDFRIPFAFDKKLLQMGKGTNVLFGDGYVGFEKPDKFFELGIVYAKD